jgi:hypothetical protein
MRQYLKPGSGRLCLRLSERVLLFKRIFQLVDSGKIQHPLAPAQFDAAAALGHSAA